MVPPFNACPSGDVWHHKKKPVLRVFFLQTGIRSRSVFRQASMLLAAAVEMCPEGKLLLSSSFGRVRSVTVLSSSVEPSVSSSALVWMPIPFNLDEVHPSVRLPLGVASAVAPKAAKEKAFRIWLASVAVSLEPKSGVSSTAQSERASSAWSICSSKAVPTGAQTWGDEAAPSRALEWHPVPSPARSAGFHNRSGCTDK